MRNVVKSLFKRWLMIAAGSVLLLVLSGCGIIKDPKALMETPQLSSDKESLASVINAETKGAQKIRPRDVNDISSIRTIDLNNDGIMEAIVFYETPDEAVRIHGLILEYVNGVWSAKTTFDGEGQVLETFSLRDITGDGRPDIIAGFSSGEDDAQKGLIVYTYDGEEVYKLLSLPYYDFLLDDMNQDNQLDLTAITLKPDHNAVVVTYQYDGTYFKELDHIDLDDPIKEYYNAVSGNITPDLKGLVLDASFGSHYAYSHILVMQEGKWVNLLPSQDYTFKNYPVFSGDVNNDGILEIARSEKPKGWEDKPYDDLPLFSYYQWDGEGLSFVQQQYMDPQGRFYFNLPVEWRDTVTIDPKSDVNEHLWFTRLDDGQVVAEIRFFSLSEWDKNKEDWELLSRENNSVIGFLSHTDVKLNKGEKEIKRTGSTN